MIQGRNGAGFAGKPLRILFRGDLDGHIAPEAGIAGAIDLAHATRADPFEDLVRTEFLTQSQGHGFSDDSNAKGETEVIQQLWPLSRVTG